MKTVADTIKEKQEEFKHATKRPNIIKFCPDIVHHMKLGVDYKDECVLYGEIPSYLKDAKCIKCKVDSGKLFIVYRMTDEIKRIIEGGREHVISREEN